MEKNKFDISHLFIQDFILSKLAKDDEELLKYFMKQGEMLLCVAARCGYTNAVKLLLRSRANIDLKNKDGHTPLNYAWHSKHPETAKLLLECCTDSSFVHISKAKKVGVISSCYSCYLVSNSGFVYATTLPLLLGVGISIVRCNFL